jgi:hypothetical protein
MTDDQCPPVAVSRRICAPAHDIFQVLANPARHPEFDGSQSLDATVVTEIYDCSRTPEEARTGMDNGKAWLEAMTKTLERLDALCAVPPSANEDH